MRILVSEEGNYVNRAKNKQNALLLTSFETDTAEQYFQLKLDNQTNCTFTFNLATQTSMYYVRGVHNYM